VGPAAADAEGEAVSARGSKKPVRGLFKVTMRHLGNPTVVFSSETVIASDAGDALRLCSSLIESFPGDPLFASDVEMIGVETVQS
jgi:hypothetical protein